MENKNEITPKKTKTLGDFFRKSRKEEPRLKELKKRTFMYLRRAEKAKRDTTKKINYIKASLCISEYRRIRLMRAIIATSSIAMMASCISMMMYRMVHLAALRNRKRLENSVNVSN